MRLTCILRLILIFAEQMNIHLKPRETNPSYQEGWLLILALRFLSMSTFLISNDRRPMGWIPMFGFPLRSTIRYTNLERRCETQHSETDSESQFPTNDMNNCTPHTHGPTKLRFGKSQNYAPLDKKYLLNRPWGVHWMPRLFFPSHSTQIGLVTRAHI